MTDGTQVTNEGALIKKIDAMIERQFPPKYGRDDLKEPTKQFILETLEHYHDVLGFEKEPMFDAMEKRRDYWAANYYQPRNFPRLDGVTVVETLNDAKKLCASGKYRCPSCNGESTDMYECTCDGCNWKAYGLFGTLGKGLRIVVKETFLDQGNVHEIFAPIREAA